MDDPENAPVAGILTGSAGIPTIDLAGDERPVAGAVGRACAEWGFFQVTGHGVDAGLAAAALDEARALFALPKSAKRALSRSRSNPWGYYDRELTKNARDKKEVFDIGPDPAPGDPFTGQTAWPAQRPRFEPALRAYFRACEGLAGRLTEAVCRSLGAPEGGLRTMFEPNHTSFLRLNRYPVEDPLGSGARKRARLGIHHHTDAGALTVLLQDEVSGLQVLRGGVWYDVIPAPGAFIINIGDMVQVWSNDLYRAPVHRVLAMESAERHSLAFFHNPSYTARIAPLDAAVRRSGAPRYRGIEWGEFRRRRADGDYADYGPEVQIGDYALGRDEGVR